MVVLTDVAQIDYLLKSYDNNLLANSVVPIITIRDSFNYDLCKKIHTHAHTLECPFNMNLIMDMNNLRVHTL